MIYASTQLHEPSNTKVFVDASGRRKKMVAVSGICAALGAALYIGVVVAGLIQSPQVEPTVSTTTSSSPH